MQNKIKLVYFFELYPIFYQPYIEYVIKKMDECDDIDFSIKAFIQTEQIGENVEIFPSVKIRRLYEFFDVCLFKRRFLTYPEIKLAKHDIIHVQHSFLFTKIKKILELPRINRPKVVITLRGGDTYIKPWMSEKWRKFYKNKSEYVDAFIVMSKHQKIYLQKWGVPSNKIHVIPISFGSQFQIEPKYPNKKVVKIVSVFRMCWEKNIEANLKVIYELKKNGINVKYDVFGDGKDLGSVYYLVDMYGLNDEVNIHGKVPNNELKELLPNFDFYLQLSHSESLGMSVIEAQSIGVPAIVSNVGGLPEVVKNNNTGIVLNLTDIKESIKRITELWNNKDLYYQYSKNAITRSQANYNVDLESKKLIDLYRKLMMEP